MTESVRLAWGIALVIPFWFFGELLDTTLGLATHRPISPGVLGVLAIYAGIAYLLEHEIKEIFQRPIRSPSASMKNRTKTTMKTTT